jgi:hypothetical protein
MVERRGIMYVSENVSCWKGVLTANFSKKIAIHIVIHILFFIFPEEKWIVVNVSHVNECVKIYKDYIGVFPENFQSLKIS